MKTVRQIQQPVVEALIRGAEKVGANLYLADTTFSPRPTFWFCGTSAQRKELIYYLNASDIRVFRLQGRKRKNVDLESNEAQHAIAYQKHVSEGIVVHGAGSGIEIAFCAYDSETDLWKARRAGVESDATSAYLRKLNKTEFLGFQLPTLSNAAALQKQCSDLGKVDLVYTWVDGNDPIWKARKRQALGEMGRHSLTADSVQDTRFDSQQEILFSIRSVIRYFVDIGNVYIVTDGQTPLFLGNLLNRVKIIDHREIFSNMEFLPSFNSHAIASNLHRIPGLKEHYLYLNDDIIFASAVSAANFFDEYGRSFQFVSSAACLPGMAKEFGEIAANAAGINNRRLLSEKMGIYAFRKYKHTALPTLRSVMEQMERDLPEAWAATLPNKFRSDSDFSIAGSLYQNYASAKGKAVRGSIRYGYYNTANPGSINDAKELLRSDWVRPQIFCINDTIPSELASQTKTKILDVVKRLLPETDGKIEKMSYSQTKPRRRWGLYGPRILQL